MMRHPSISTADRPLWCFGKLPRVTMLGSRRRCLALLVFPSAFPSLLIVCGIGYGSTLCIDNGRGTKIREAGAVTLVDGDICLSLAVNGCMSAQ